MRVPRAEDAVVGDIEIIETVGCWPRPDAVGSDALLPRGALNSLEDLS